MYIAKVSRDRARYHKEDEAAAKLAVESGAPQRTAITSAFNSIAFDRDEIGVPVIDITFKNAPIVKSMCHEELQVAMQAIYALCYQLEIDGAHLLLPAPAAGAAGKVGAHQ